MLPPVILPATLSAVPEVLAIATVVFADVVIVALPSAGPTEIAVVLLAIPPVPILMFLKTPEVAAPLPTLYVALAVLEPIVALAPDVVMLLPNISPVPDIVPAPNSMLPPEILAVVVMLAALTRADTTFELKLNPVAFKLPPVMLPLALIKPVTYSPVVAHTMTFDVPATPTVTLELLNTNTLLVPLLIFVDVAVMPVNADPLPMK